MLCKNCGKKLNDNTTICPVCGKATGVGLNKSQFVQPQQPHKITSQASDNTSVPKRFCNKCGNTIAPDAKFCIHCGGDSNNSYKPQPNYSKPQDGRFAAIMKTNKKRNMIIAAISFLLVIIIAILIILLRPASSKIIGKWDIYASTNNKGEMEDESDITFEFTDDGRIIITDNNETQSGSYIIEDNVIYTRRGDYTKDFGIKKIDGDDLVLYKLDAPEFEYYFHRR